MLVFDINEEKNRQVPNYKCLKRGSEAERLIIKESSSPPVSRSYRHEGQAPPLLVPSYHRSPDGK